LKKREDIEYARLKKIGRERNFWTMMILEAHHKKLLPLDFDTFLQTYSILGDFNTEHVVMDCGAALEKQLKTYINVSDIFVFSGEEKEKWDMIQEFRDGMMDIGKTIAEKNGLDIDFF